MCGIQKCANGPRFMDRLDLNTNADVSYFCEEALQVNTSLVLFNEESNKHQESSTRSLRKEEKKTFNFTRINDLGIHKAFTMSYAANTTSSLYDICISSSSFSSTYDVDIKAINLPNQPVRLQSQYNSSLL